MSPISPGSSFWVRVEANGQGSFWAKAEATDRFILFDTVQFSDSNYTHRALLPDGRRVLRGGSRRGWLTVACRHPRLGKLIRDIEIDWNGYHPEIHLKTLDNLGLACKKVKPWRDSLARFIDDKLQSKHRRRFSGKASTVVAAEWHSLANVNERIIHYIAEEKGIDSSKFTRASQMAYIGELDHLNAMFQLELLLRWSNATTYLSGPSWRNYAPNLREVLSNHGIGMEEVK